MKDYNKLNVNEKAIVLDKLVNYINAKNKDCGTVFGSYQILEIIENLAIESGFIECPKCHNKKR